MPTAGREPETDLARNPALSILCRRAILLSRVHAARKWNFSFQRYTIIIVSCKVDFYAKIAWNGWSNLCKNPPFNDNETVDFYAFVGDLAVPNCIQKVREISTAWHSLRYLAGKANFCLDLIPRIIFVKMWLKETSDRWTSKTRQNSFICDYRTWDFIASFVVTIRSFYSPHPQSCLIGIARVR